MRKINGFLIALDGVLYIENEAIEGAIDTLFFLQKNKYSFRFLTNTTMISRKSLAAKLLPLGFEAQESDIFNTCTVAACWLKQQGFRRLHRLLPQNAHFDFTEFASNRADL